MKSQKIKVSVIMACHNSAAYLNEAVDSVLGQTLKDLELILIDDCSTDNTLEIANHYQEMDERVSIIKLPENAGPAAARNAGICVAKGEWLGILDSDDVAMPTRFEEQLKLVNSDKNLVMIGCDSISINKQGQLIKEHKYPTDHQKLIKRLYTAQGFPPHSSMLYRREVVAKEIGFNSRYVRSQDFDMWLRLSEIGKIASLDKALVKIRIHEQNISNTEGGRLQLRYGCAASICHFLRAQGCSDPSTSGDESTWQVFITWVDARMMEEGFFDRRKAWARARSEYFTTERRLVSGFRFSRSFLQSSHASMLVWEKFFGSSLPQRLSREWVNRSCAD